MELIKFFKNFWTRTLSPSLKYLNEKQTEQIVSAIDAKKIPHVNPSEIFLPITNKLEETNAALNEFSKIEITEVSMKPLVKEMKGIRDDLDQNMNSIEKELKEQKWNIKLQLK